LNAQLKRIDEALARYDAMAADKAQPRDLLKLGFTMSEARVHLDIPYLVKGIFDRGQIVVIWGGPGSGKTFTAISLAAHCAVGEPWCGRRTKPGKVLYVCAESTRKHLENRASALKAKYPYLQEAEVVFVPLAMDLLQGKQDIEDVITAARAMGECVLIVVDTLAVTFGGGNENSPEDMGQYVSNIKRIRDSTGAALLIVHHCGKDEAKGMRGHTSLLGATDGELIVEIDSNAQKGVNDRILRAGKLREGDSNSDLCSFSLEVSQIGLDEDRDPVQTCVMVPAVGLQVVRRPSRRTENQLLAALEADFAEGKCVWTELEIRDKAKGFMHRNTVTKTVHALAKEGFLVQSVGGFILARSRT
jgi:predicted ATP-dependent serine protease